LHSFVVQIALIRRVGEEARLGIAVSVEAFFSIRCRIDAIRLVGDLVPQAPTGVVAKELISVVVSRIGVTLGLVLRIISPNTIAKSRCFPKTTRIVQNEREIKSRSSGNAVL
jgi:hypothetical protein